MKTLPPTVPFESTRPGAGWSFYAAFGLSTALHLLLLVIGAWVMLGLASPPSATPLEGGLADRRVPRLEHKLITAELPDVTVTETRDRSQTSRLRRSASSLPAARIDRPLVRASLLPENAFGTNRSTDWLAKVGAAEPSAGAGEGNGDGTNGGLGFFKVKGDVKSVVFVVDCSTSMRKPHASKWKTRFRRLQAELLHAIDGLNADQRFFIIFFNDKAIPMPARSLQPASRNVKRYYLRWMARQRANGETDPRNAMALALRLQPDAIYFLTDGVFGFGIRKQLLAVKQDRVAIHTFAFGNQKAETSMKAIAEANGGKYVFVP